MPEFGNWESQENVPYTLYFDKARKGRGGKMINPNDPEENPEMFSNVAPSPPAASTPSPSRIRAQVDEINGRGSVKPEHDRRVSREDGNFRQFADAPARGDNLSRRTSGESTHQHSSHAGGDNLGRRTSGESTHQHSSHGSHPGRPVRQSAGSEHSIERSPLHSNQAKLSGRGGASPAWDGKSSHDSNYGAPGKPRMKPATRVDESVSIPSFLIILSIWIAIPCSIFT